MRWLLAFLGSPEPEHWTSVHCALRRGLAGTSFVIRAFCILPLASPSVGQDDPNLLDRLDDVPVAAPALGKHHGFFATS